MQTTINLRRLFDFSMLPIIITVVVLALLTVAIVLMYLYDLLKQYQPKPKEEVVEQKPAFVKPDLSKLKAEYMAKLNAIEQKYNEDTTKIRPAYEGMSKVVREFVYKVKCFAFKKDEIKERYCDLEGFKTREENRALSVKATDFMIHTFNNFASLGNDLILEANFRHEELSKIKEIGTAY